MKIILFLILIPFVEIYTFIKVGSLIGAMTTIWITIISAIVGISLVKKESNKEQIKAFHKMQEGIPPVKETLSSLYLFLSGVLLLLPGLVTDFIGALLLFPFVRLTLSNLILKKLGRSEFNFSSQADDVNDSVQIRIQGRIFSHKPSHDGVIEGIISEKQNDN